jgi:hypothetical protein
MLSVTSLFSQNFEPSQKLFKWGLTGDSTYISADSVYFKQTKPIIGWHWAGPLKISQSLLVNQFDGHRDWESYNYTTDDFLDGYHLIIKPDEYSHAVDSKILNARGIQFEATLKLDPNDLGKLVIRAGDTTRPVFGFSYIRGFIPTNPSDPNFNRLIIHRDSTHLVGQVILDNPWPQNQLLNI